MLSNMAWWTGLTGEHVRCEEIGPVLCGKRCWRRKGPLEVKTRDTARVVLFNPPGEVLLFKYEDAAPADPQRPELTEYWGTPGGGLDPGETFEQAALRELWEETGINDARLGPCIWTRSRQLLAGRELLRFNERYYLAHTAASRITFDHTSAFELSLIRDHRWWSPGALEQSDETFLPLGFVELLRRIASGDIPSPPIRLGQ